jgi:hypothetical protein
MSLGRLLAIAIVLVVAWWVFTKSGLFSRSEPGAIDGKAPIERARDASRKSAERDAARSSAQAEADKDSSGGAITENMTPDQVRALLGSPSDIQSETMESGARREKWIYSSVGKTVTFENGVVVSIQ